MLRERHTANFGSATLDINLSYTKTTPEDDRAQCKRTILALDELEGLWPQIEALNIEPLDENFNSVIETCFSKIVILSKDMGVYGPHGGIIKNGIEAIQGALLETVAYRELVKARVPEFIQSPGAPLN